MTKSDLIKELNKLQGYLEDIQRDIVSLKDNVENAISCIENMPYEANEIEEDPKDESFI